MLFTNDVSGPNVCAEHLSFHLLINPLFEQCDESVFDFIEPDLVMKFKITEEMTL